MIICAKYGKIPSRTAHTIDWTRQNVPYSTSFIANSWLNDLGNIGQKSLCMTHPLMLMIICTECEKNPSRTVCAVERIRQDVPYFSNFIAKSWLNYHEDIDQGQRSMHATHSLMLVIIGAKYEKNPPRTVCAVQRSKQDVTYFNSFFSQMHVWITLKIYVNVQGHYARHTFC